MNATATVQPQETFKKKTIALPDRGGERDLTYFDTGETGTQRKGTILILPGIMGTPEHWEKFAKKMSTEGFRCLVVQLQDVANTVGRRDKKQVEEATASGTALENHYKIQADLMQAFAEKLGLEGQNFNVLAHSAACKTLAEWLAWHDMNAGSATFLSPAFNFVRESNEAPIMSKRDILEHAKPPEGGAEASNLNAFWTQATQELVEAGFPVDTGSREFLHQFFEHHYQPLPEINGKCPPVAVVCSPRDKGFHQNPRSHPFFKAIAKKFDGVTAQDGLKTGGIVHNLQLSDEFIEYYRVMTEKPGKTKPRPVTKPESAQVPA
jgi:pimeloyl-ACP methyl ester carboxylesterase